MLRRALFLGVLGLACGSNGSTPDASDDSGGAAGQNSGGSTATGGTSGSGNGGAGGTPSGGSGTGGTQAGAGGEAGTGEGGESGSGAGTSGSAGEGGGAGQTSCGGSAGPSMIALDGFCIDATEVTWGDYMLFMDFVETEPTLDQPAACAWNTSFEPNATTANGEDETYPVRGVDWCDAYAYCAWAGKRLCGNPSGSAATYAEPANADTSQWFSACSADGMKAFPYGDTYDAQACNGGDYGADGVGPLPAGSVATCVGGTPGIYDMSGNVWEWEDSCETSTGETDLCRARGGAFGNGADFHRCDYGGFSPARNFNAGPTGIRCCSR